MKTTVILCVFVATFAVGCSDKKTPSKDNFKQVINTYLATDLGCTRAPWGIGNKKIDVVVKGFLAPTEKDGDAFIKRRDQIEVFDHLSSEGLYELKVIDELKNSFGGQLKNSYTLTDKGQKTFRTDGSKVACAGNLEVDEIKNYSEPSAAMGHTISQVMYSSKQKAVEPWVEVIRSKKTSFFESEKKLKDSKTVLVLLNDGWAHESALR